MSNKNRIIANNFSSPDTKRMYDLQWPDEPLLRQNYQEGHQCGACSYFAPLNEDWGICCHPKSRHCLETIFEHFTCAEYAGEGWGPHSFSKRLRCKCGGVEIPKSNNK